MVPYRGPPRWSPPAVKKMGKKMTKNPQQEVKPKKFSRERKRSNWDPLGGPHKYLHLGNKKFVVKNGTNPSVNRNKN